MSLLDDVLDPDQLAELQEVLTDNSPELLADFVHSYLTDLTEQLAALRRAVAAGDGVVVRRIGHTLKSSSQTMAAVRLADRFAAIEHLSDSEIAAGAVDLTGLALAAIQARSALLGLL